MQEEIQLQKYRTGTTIIYFNRDITEENYPITTYPATLYLNNQGNPYDLIVTDNNNNQEVWKLSGSDNINRIATVAQGGRVIHGRMFEQLIERSINDITGIQQKFINKMDQMFTAGTESYVMSKTKLLEDINVFINIERSFDILNTISTYNKTYNQIPKRNSKTGVVFGKIEAIQKIKDEDGNNIRIPLREIPVAIFNPTDKFPTINSVDDNGNRLRMYFQDKSVGWPNENYYTNPFSHEFDKEFLLEKESYLFDANSREKKMPDEFLFSTLTNENGEFILNNIPTGPQTLMFEVDLLQQGLSKEEVALNFFPYRGDNISNIDEVPHFFFRQIPIDVLPSWGYEQSGYTQVDVSVNLDLRKWTTYFFPTTCTRVSNVAKYYFDNATYDLLDKSNKGDVVLDKAGYNVSGTIEYPKTDVFMRINSNLLYKYTPAPLVVEVRDMTKQGYPKTGIQMVNIDNILDKEGGRLKTLIWNNEFSQIRNRAEFRHDGYNVIKLPANLYDPEGYKTNLKGKPRIGIHNKGIWLTSYQFKLFHSDDIYAYRTTGFDMVDWGTLQSRDHFHLNANVGIIQNSQEAEYVSSMVEGNSGVFPYEKPWTINYPKKYSIPQEPTKIANFTSLSGRAVMESPVYVDGHKIGIGRLDGNDIINSHNSSNGIGLNAFTDIQDYDFDLIRGFYATTFLYSITNESMYHYEYAPWKLYGNYANGYIQGRDSFVDTNSITRSLPKSVVKNGEEYQRVESGYGYYLHPYGWPRIGYSKFGFDFACELDNYYSTQGTNSPVPPGISSRDGKFYFTDYYICKSINFKHGSESALRLDAISDGIFKTLNNQGSLTIYRLLNTTASDPTQTLDLIDFTEPIKSIVNLHLGKFKIQNAKKSNTNNLQYKKSSSKQKDWQYWGEHSNLNVGIADQVVLTIVNNGKTNAQITFMGKTVVIPQNSSYDFSPNIRGEWNNESIILQTNDGLVNKNNNWIYEKLNYKITFKGFIIPRKLNGNNTFELPEKEINIKDYVIKNSNPNLYILSTDSLNTERKCNDDSKYDYNNIMFNGLYFSQKAQNSTSNFCGFNEKNIQNLFTTACTSNETPSTTCYCSAYDGFVYLIDVLNKEITEYLNIKE